ncbi:MAG: N-acetylmuramoyl-L-alanine amidase [Rhodospirillales bacterium]|nr:MAG: N-acetylmuramoyl-L-alanine amidase [Rhodospirillales bacterium]
MLVMHYTGMRTAAEARARLCDPAARVSAHYLVDEDGTVTPLVPEVRRAWHAGVAFWRGRTDINARSIGIELVNPGHEFGYRPFPEAQMTALRALAEDIIRRHGIPARNVVGHSDVAPMRKQDPGELFDWAGLAPRGIGLWPAEADDCPMDAAVITAMLGEVGYDLTDPTAALKAFQRHFRPSRVTGRVDTETVRRLSGLVAMCRADQ